MLYRKKKSNLDPLNKAFLSTVELTVDLSTDNCYEKTEKLFNVDCRVN